MRKVPLLVAIGAALAMGAAAVVMAVPASAANLLTNPGFESGNLSGWSCSGGSVVSSPVHSGTNPSPSTSASPTGSPAPGAPGKPGNPNVTGTTNSSISLSWGASSGTVSGYRVYEGTTVRATVNGTGTSTTVSGLGTCTSHTYTVAAFNNSGESAKSGSVTGSTTGCPQGSAMAAPYIYNGWGDPPSATSVMSATGIKQFTMAFMLSGGGCVPKWDSQRALTGGVDQ